MEQTTELPHGAMAFLDSGVMWHQPDMSIRPTLREERAMTKAQHIYGEVENKTDLKHVFSAIRGDIDQATSRDGLTELYKRAGYLITLTYAPSWKEKFGDEANDLRAAAEEQFTTTVRKLNRRAKTIGTEADYDEKWGK